MGSFNESIILRNATDASNVVRGTIKAQDVRETQVDALVDTGAMTLVINEKTRQKLGLSIMGACPVSTANGVRQAEIA
jgi:predicted aspartyl protease